MKKKKSSLFWILLVLIVLLAAGILFIVMQEGGVPGSGEKETGHVRQTEGKRSDEPGQEEPVEPDILGQETTVPDQTEPAMAVETPYCALYYPEKWQDRVNTTVEQGDVVRVCYSGTFSGEQTHNLFDVVFSQAPEGSLGAVAGENQTYAYVHINPYDPDEKILKSEGDVRDFYAMQEDINFLIDRIPFTTVPAAQPEQEAMASVQTPYGDLIYPQAAADQMHVTCTEGDAYTVDFFWKKDESNLLPLFTLSFSGEKEGAYGFLADSGTAVHVTVHPLEQELTEEEQDVALGLQEMVNDVLAGLTFGSGKQEAQNDPELAIETPYGILYYPDVEQQSLRVEANQHEAGFTVCFLYLSENDEECSLFDISFEKPGDVFVGQVETKDGNSVKVYLTGYDMVFDDSWSEEEITRYQMMAETVNDILTRYAQDYSFTFAG